MRQVGIAGAEDHVAPEVDVELLPRRGLHVDLRKDAEALALQRSGHFADHLIESGVGESPLESVAQRSHDLSPLSL